MNPFAPTNPGILSALGVVVALGVVALILLALTRALLTPFTTRQRAIIGWFLGTLCVGTLAFGWLAISVPALRTIFVGDAASYHTVIADLSRALPDIVAPDPAGWADRGVFLYGVALTQALFGINGYISVVVNVLLAGVTLLVMVDLTRMLAGRSVATAAAGVVALLPALVLWAATPLREILVLCLTVVCVDGAVRLAREPNLRWLALTLLPAILMVRTREVQTLALAAAIAVAVAMATWDRLPVGARRAVTHPVTVVLACVVALVVTVALGPQLHRAAESVAFQTQTTTFNLQVADSPTTPALDRADPTSPAELAARTPRALVSYLWGPGPTATAPSLMMLEAASLWLLTPLVLFGGWIALRTRCREVWILMAAAAPAALIGALTLGNYGIISRLRVITWLLLLPLAAWAIADLHTRWQARSFEPVVATEDVPATHRAL